MWAVRGSLKIPLASIENVSVHPPALGWGGGLRLGGLHIPGLVKAGTYQTKQGNEFWYATKDKLCLSIELKKGSYTRIILGLKDGETWAERIRQAAGKTL